MDLRFTDKQLLPWSYRRKFLLYTQLEAPEVLQSLKALIPKYRQVINDYPSTEDLREWLNGELDVEYPDNPELAQSVRREILDYRLAWVDRSRTFGESEIVRTEESAWNDFLDLRDSFATFTERFNLTTDWLRTGLFRLLGNLARSEQHYNSLCYVYSHGWWPAHGEAIQLDLEGWKMEETWKEFEARANEKFSLMLMKHKNQTASAWRASGYKQTTKPLDFTSVKWLVLWTVKGMSKADILALIDKENEPSGKIYDLKSLEKSFRTLKTYGLPVRRKQNPGSKNGID